VRSHSRPCRGQQADRERGREARLACHRPATRCSVDLAGKSETQIVALRGDLNAQLTTLNQTVDKRLGHVRGPAGATVKEAQGLIAPSKKILTNGSVTSNLLFDCDHNPDCLASRVIPAPKFAEHMANAGEKTMNAIAAAAPPPLRRARREGRRILRAGTRA
jgi:hypothetical protein